MRQIRVSWITRAGVFLSLMITSWQANAIAQQVLEQSADTINTLLIAVAVVISALALFATYLKISQSRAQRKLQDNQQTLDQKNALLDNFHVGIVHLNSAGEILYSNKLAAYYLGNRADKIQSSPLQSLLDQKYSDGITASSQSKVQSQTQVTGPVKDRQLILEFSPQRNEANGIANIVSIIDISPKQQIIDTQKAELQRNNALLNATAIGQLEIDFPQKTCHINECMAQLLGLPDSSQEMELKQFESYLDQSTQFQWNQAIKDLQNGNSVELSCKFKNQDTTLYAKLVGIVVALDDKQKGLKAHLTVTSQNELQQTKQQLAGYKQQVKGMLRSSSHPMYLLDQQSNVIGCNTAFELLFNTSIENIRNKPAKHLDFFSETLRDLQPEPGGSSTMNYSAGAGLATEVEIAVSSEQTKTLKVKVQTLRDDDGNAVGAVGLLEDISEQKRVNKQLEQERAHFANIINKAPLGIAMIDDDDRIIEANKSLIQRLQLSAQELKKGSFYQLFNDPKNSGKAAKKLHKNGRLEGFHAHLVGKSGALYPSELNIELFDKEKQQFLCWISDISDEQYQQDKFESLLLHSSMPMAVLTEEGFNKLNPAACEFFSLEDEEELFGCFPYSSQLNDDQVDLQDLQQKIEFIKQDGQALSLLWQHHRKGQPLPCQATFVPMFKGQDFDSILCIWTDLRAIKKADAERMEAVNLHQAAERLIVEKQQLLESSQDQLASKVRSLTDTESKLQAAVEDLTDKESEISDLQQAHNKIAQHLDQLQQDYQQSRSSLASSEKANEELAEQLEQSSNKVRGLEKQRNQIADELQYSEKKYKDAQQELADSEQTARKLEQERADQQDKMHAFEQQITDLKSSIDQKDQQISDVNGQISALQSKLNSSSQASEKLRQQLINQRKASEAAEQQRRELEQSCYTAQSELSNKARHIDHLQHEMDKFEEMSKQQKGDMEKQQAMLEKELASKQQQLQQTQKTLDETKRQSEQEKAEKEYQQQKLEQLQHELAEVEKNSEEQQQKIAEADKKWREQQKSLQKALQEKQHKLQQTEQVLQQQEQQVEAEKAAKAEQQKLFERLQSELAEMEKRSEAQQQQKIEEANQRMQEQQRKWQQELEAKQQKLQQAEQTLNQAKQQTEAEKEQQRQLMERLQTEMAEIEKRSEEQQKQVMAEADKRWKDEQDALQKELQAKQQRLNETEKMLRKTAQQTEAENAAKAQQQEIFAQLQAELAEMEQRSRKQQQEMQQSDQQWLQRQETLKKEVEEKQAQLQATRKQLDDNQRQADAEKRERLEQQQKLEQLKVELTDVESRASKQKEMLQGSDEQWRQHHAEIEQQKSQLQAALVEAQQQNAQMQSQLQQSLQELKKAESQVSDTVSGEQKLLAELERARDEAQQLQQKLKQQEQQELKLQQQLSDQQKALQSSEQNVHNMQSEQQQLAKELQAIQAEYDSTKKSLNAQDSNQSELTQKLQQLEQELNSSKQQIASKETALEDAQKQLQSSQTALQDKEKALIAAHQEELKQAKEQTPQPAQVDIPDFAKLAMPKEPQVWFDLLPYLQKNPPKESLAVSLRELMTELQTATDKMDKAVSDDDNKSILTEARKLAFLARKVNSAPLDDAATRLEADFRNGQVDSISIYWPSLHESLQTTLRVIYSHLHS